MSHSSAGRLSVVANAFGSHPREVSIAARAAGFSGLTFDCFGAIDLTELSITGQREWLRHVTQQGLRLTALQIDLGRSGLGPGADVERQLHRVERAMIVASQLRASVFCVELGQLPRARVAVAPRAPISSALAGVIFLPEPLTAPVADVLPPPDPTFVAQVAFALSELGQRADRMGVTLAFSSALSDLRALDAALSGAACPWFGVDLDPVALLRDDLSLDAAFSMVGNLSRHVRIKDAIVGDDHRTRPVVVGSGNVDWPAFLSALEAAGYGGDLTVDPIDLADRRSGAREAVSQITRFSEAL